MISSSLISYPPSLDPLLYLVRKKWLGTGAGLGLYWECGEVPTCLKGLGEKGLAASGGRAPPPTINTNFIQGLCHHLSSSGGLRAMSALCMSNSRSAPPGCMMDGSGKAGLGSCQSPLQSLRPHPPQSLRPSSLPTFSLHSAEALSSQFSIHPTSPSPHHPLFDSLTSVPFRCQVSSLEHLLLLSPGQAVSCSDQPGCRRQRLYLVCVWGGVGGAGLAHREPRGQLYEFIHVLLLFPHALE